MVRPVVDPPRGRSRPAWLVDGAVIAAVWSVVALLQIVDEDRDGRLVFHLAVSASWALMTVPIVTLARRFDPGRTGWMRAVLGVCALGLVVAFVQDTVAEVAWDLFAEPPRRRDGVADVLRHQFDDHLLTVHSGELVIFFLVFGAALVQAAHRRLQAQEARSSRLQTELVEARLATLRNQLNPHFFFNTLHAVSGFIESDPRRARTLIARIGDLMRVTLRDSARQEVPLSQELDFLDAYLDVARARFGEQIDVRLDIDPDVRDALVPELLFQPLVENALQHGLEALGGRGVLRIEAARVGHRLRLVVADNGPGFGPEEAREGVGLRNVRARLRHLYGPDHHFAATTGADGGAVIVVEVPFHEEGELYAGA